MNYYIQTAVSFIKLYHMSSNVVYSVVFEIRDSAYI